MPDTADVALIIEPDCEHCEQPPRLRDGAMMMAMDPGADQVPWFLCIPCWLDGLFPAGSPKLSGRIAQPSTVVVLPAAVPPAADPAPSPKPRRRKRSP